MVLSPANQILPMNAHHMMNIYS